MPTLAVSLQRISPICWAFTAFVLYALASAGWTLAGSNLSRALIVLGAQISGFILPFIAPVEIALLACVVWIIVAFFLGNVYYPIAFGAFAALAIVGLYCYRLWWLAIPLFPLLFFAHSRGAWLATSLGLMAKFTNRLWVVGAILALVGIASFWHISPDDTLRVHLWSMALNNLTLLGHGIGSFLSLWYRWDGEVHQAEYVHNDYIQFLFEYGIGAFFILYALGLGLARRSSACPLLISASVMATFFMPFQIPFTAFLSCLALGAVAQETQNA